MLTTQLIELYCTVCDQYSTTLSVQVQRMSNNSRPQFTDEEAITVYLWGILNGRCEQKAAYEFTLEYYPGWFPKLPCYTNFSRRLNILAPAFMAFWEALMERGEAAFGRELPPQVIDSMPIMVAKQARSSYAKVAPEVCNKGYCSTKKEFYYGVKLHIRGSSRKGYLPLPSQVFMSRASDYDLTVAKQLLENQHGFLMYADKAYRDKEWFAERILRNQITVVTPCKKKKTSRSALVLSRAIFCFRQQCPSTH